MQASRQNQQVRGNGCLTDITRRPSQTQTVQVKRFRLRGSIYEYCVQMAKWKRAASVAGLDFGEQVGESETFKHIDTILQEFCDALD